MLLLLAACRDLPPVQPEVTPPDLTEPLSAGQVRAGVVTDPASLFGGVSAEGAVGDVKIYNADVRFVIQAARESSYYVEQGGGVIDADVTRPDGVPGRDLLDELAVMAGFGRVVAPSKVEVLADGTDGEARVRVTGTSAPLTLVNGALESDSVIPEYELDIVTDYVLMPDARALRMETTVTNREGEPVTLAVGDAGFVAFDVAEGWRPGEGRDPGGSDPVPFTAIVSGRNELAIGLVAEEGDLELGSAASVIASIGPLFFGFAPEATIAPDESTTFTRYFAVATDLATISGDRVARQGLQAETIEGTVTAGGTPVGGARVHVLDAAGAPLTVAVTDAEGRWAATTEAGTAASFVASGRGDGTTWDLPAGAGWAAAYAADDATTLASLRDGAAPIPFAEGHGVSAASSSPDLELTPPGTLHVTIADAGPALVRVAFAVADPVVADERFVPGRPGGYAALGFVRDGDLDLPLEPGDYVVTVSRGARDSVTTTSVTVASGGVAEVTADLSRQWELPGVYSGDPHTHASPSGDGGISMERRLVSMAAFGVDAHFGTDHDHVADYRPLLAPLGLDERLISVVADEVSPVLRGHFNAWPATQTPGAANGGAPMWWLGYEDTAEIFGWMRALVGEAGIVQLNHPVGDSGMFSYAGYDTSTGQIRRPDHWSDDFQAVEVLNSGDWDDYFPTWLDLVSRGQVAAPVGTSDAHGATSGHLGASFTWFVADELSSDGLAAAVRAGSTVASTGPFVQAEIDGAFAPGATFVGSATLAVTVYAPDWMPVETVTLYRDGEAVAVEACAGAAPTPCAVSWDLAPEADAVYVVMAASTAATMSGVQPGDLAWAVTGPVRVDVGGDGWTPAKAAPWGQ